MPVILLRIIILLLCWEEHTVSTTFINSKVSKTHTALFFLVESACEFLNVYVIIIMIMITIIIKIINNNSDNNNNFSSCAIQYLHIDISCLLCRVKWIPLDGTPQDRYWHLVLMTSLWRFVCHDFASKNVPYQKEHTMNNDCYWLLLHSQGFTLKSLIFILFYTVCLYSFVLADLEYQAG